MYNNLFEPLSLGRGGVSARNRVVMGPMTLNQATESGHITPWIVEWYRRRAAGGVGAIVGAAVFVSQNGRGWPNAVGIADDSFTEGWRACVDAAHAHGALFGTQLFHGGAASTNALLGRQPISASDWTRPGFDPAREMTQHEIVRVTADFCDAARRSVEAGCDFVELHGAHGYLLHQFSRADVNRRTDEFGDLTRFAEAVVRGVRIVVGESIPILYRFSIHSDDPSAADHPVTPQGLERMIVELERAGVDVWDISCFKESRRGYFGSDVYLSDWVRKFSNKPRIVAGNLLTPADASQYIADGHAEGAALARALIADAEWMNKAREGNSQEIRQYTDEFGACLKNGFDPGCQ